MKIDDYADVLRSLPEDLTEEGVTCPELRLFRDERVSIYFWPGKLPNPAGRVLFVGLTPGRFQLWEATKAAAEALRGGVTPAEASVAASAAGSFAGPLRTNLVRMLDGIGLNDALGIASSASLWGTDRQLQASTSALRHSVMDADGENYNQSPPIHRHPVLSQLVDEVLTPRCRVGAR